MGAYADLLPDSSDSANTSSSVARSSVNQRVDAFVEQYRPIAERVAEQTGNDPELYLAKWGLETGWGKSIIPGTNNLGNIKDFSGSGVSAKDNATGSVDRYRQYKDANQFADDYASILKRRYKNALNVGSDMDTFATELKRAGYAEDPNYVSKLKSAYNMLGGSAAQSDASQPSPNARGEYEPRTDYSAALRQFDKVPNDTYEANRLASTPKGMSISKEISAAIDSYQANLWSIPAAMGSEYALNAMLENKSAAEQQWADSGAPQSFSEMEFGKNFGQYFAHMAIQSAPYMLEFIASGFGVGSLAKGALANTAKGVAEKAAIEAAKQGATKEAAKKAGEVAAKEFMGTVYTASGVAGSYPSAVGDVLSNQYEQSGKFNLPAAAALGVPYAALNAAGAEGMLTRGLARGLPKTSLTAKGAAGFAGRAALTGAEAGLMEGSTETGQEVMNQLGRMAVDPDAKIDDKRALEAYKESFIAGGLLGGVPGAVAGGFRKPEDAKLQPPAPVANSPLTSAVNTAQHVEKQQQQAAVDDHREQILGMIAQRDDLTERIAGLQNMIDRADPSSEDGQRIRAMQSDMQMRRDSLVAQLDAAKAFYGGDQTANVGPTNDPLILGNEQMSRIYQVTQNLLNDPASLDPESRSGLLKGFSVMRNRTLPEATRIDAAISLIATMDDMAARRAAAASGRADEREWNAFASDEAARDGEASRVAPNQQQGVVTQSAPALATDERARKAAAAEYEAAYQDLVKAEQLGVSDQELMQRQIAMRNAENRLQEINEAIEANRAKETAEKRGALLDRVLASNPGNPNRAFDRALRLEGFRDATFTEEEKAKIARFNELRSIQEDGVSAAPNEAGDFGIKEKRPSASAGRYQHIADMLSSGWQLANKHQLTGPNGETYNLKGAGEAQFVRNKLNQKAGNGSQSPRGGSQGRGAQGDLGAAGSGIDGNLPQGDLNGVAGSGQGQNTATPDGAVQPAEAAGNGSAPNGNVDPGQWLNEEDELNSWFGNSVVVGPDGRPMTVYHTTYKVMDEAISEFDRNHLTKINPDTGRRRKSPSLDSVGVWFSNNPAKTDAYGEGAQYPAHLKITRPVVYRTFDDLLKDWNNFHAKGFADPKLAELHQKQNEFFGDADGFVANLKQRGFDGLIILPHERAAAGDSMGSTEFRDQTAYIVFDGSQVRSVFDRRQGESVSAESVEPTIEELQAKLNAAEFGERIELNDILIKRVTADIEQLVSNGEMPAYDTGNGTFIAVHPSAQKEGMIQVTRYSDRGVMGDSQYSNVRDAVRDNSLWFKRKMNKQEAEKAIDNAIIAEADYQEQKREFERNNGKWPESRWFSTREKAQSYILSFGYGRERDGEFRRTNGPIAKIEEGSTGQGGFNVILSEFTGEVEDKLKRVSEVTGKTLNESRQAYKMLIHRLHTGDNGVYKGDYEGAVASANRTLDSTIAIHEQKQAESNKEESAKQEPAQEQEKDAEPKADTSEFEHAGYKIYRSRVNVAGEVKDYWAVQTEDNRQKGKVGFGDALHETKETAMQAANLQSQRADLAERNRIAAEEKAKSEEQAKAEKEADTYNGFLDGKTPAKKGLIRKALSKEMRINGVVSTLRNYVESSLSSGKLEVSTYEEDKIKPLSRRQFNRMDNRQQEAHEKKVREGGKVTVYEVNGYDLGKTAYDYAQHLLSQKDQSASQQKTDSAKKGQEQAAPVSQPENDKPAYADDAELQDALSHLGDVLGDVFGAKLNITGKQYGASDLLPAMSKVIELLIKKGFKSFRESVGAATNAMRGNANTKGFVDQITPRQWKAAYNSVAEFHEGTESEEDVAKYSAEQIQKIIALPEKIKEAEQATNHDATPGQKEAGNYAKGKFAWQGLTIAVETAKGEDRTDKETNGDKWRVTMPATYGYVLGSEGADGDHVDVFMGDKPESQRVYVINQTKPGSAEFDEHKVMLGYDTEDKAMVDYLLSFTGTFGHSVLGSISGPYSIDDFKSMLESNRLKHAKPISDRLAYVNPRVEESNQLPPGVRINGAKEKAAAERLAQLLDKMDQVRMDRNTPEGAAKGSIRSAIEELRKERSVGDIPGLLDTAAQRLFRQYSAFSDVASEVAESLRAADKYAETVAKFKAKQERGIALSDIEVDRQSNGTGRIKTYKQKADEALSEIDERMGLGKQLLECLNS